MINRLPIPNVKHGQRLIPSVIDDLAKNEPDSPWVSLPIDENDLSKGYKDITYSQLANAVNHAAHWLRGNLPASSEPFPLFAYAGPKDLRYPILAIAAGKLGMRMVLPSAIITTEAQLHILNSMNCRLYLRPASAAPITDEIAKRQPSIQIIVAPDLDEFSRDDPVQPTVYEKSWAEAKDDPWIVFHSSGTTGRPKPITYTHRMMAMQDTAAGLDLAESNVHQWAFRRWYTPLPALHSVGMRMLLCSTACVRTVVVLGPPHTPEVVQAIIKYGKADGALLPPALIDRLCLDPLGLQALQSLKYIQYCGAPLNKSTGAKLALHTRVGPAIGSVESGNYCVALNNDPEDWDYMSFQPHVGAVFEQRVGDLHELVFVRKPKSALQQIFLVHPDKTRHETKDLWIEHPKRKGLWKIVGRTDDYVTFSHAEGLHASSLEPIIESHELVRAALIGGHGRDRPVLLVELIPDAQERADSGVERKALLDSLQPYLEKVNAQCHPSVHLSPELVLFANKDKPFKRTIKDSVARLLTLHMYEDDIEGLFAHLT